MGTEPSQVWPAEEKSVVTARDESELLTDDKPLTGESLDARGTGITIRDCPACDGIHEGIKLCEYTRQQGPYTHFFTCPATLDPVGLSLAVLRAGQGLELSGPVCQALAEAQIAGRYFVAIWFVDDKGLHLKKNTQKFPVGDYPECLRMLRKMIEDEVGPQQPDEMKAASPRPLRNLLEAVPVAD